eukprot:g1926.t1
MARRDQKAGFRFVDAHSDTGRALYQAHGLDPDLMETNIVLLDGKAYTKMASFTAAMRSLGWPWRVLTVLDMLPTGFGNWLYDRIAQNRYRRRVVILGGNGVFGGKLAIALLRSGDLEVVVAGRNLDRAQAFCGSHGGRPALLDRAAPDFEQRLKALSPFVTVDAAGPFQAYDQAPYKVAEAALAAKSHYLDLSDDAAFTAGIGALDEKAAAAGLTVLSGVSSVPALSSAAVEALRGDFSRLDLIESAILPGNRAPRGLSVIRAILGQTGRPLAVFRDGTEVAVPGWSGLARRRIGPGDATGLSPRWTSLIGAPDLTLFPDRYGARTVLFRAGLELSVLHLGLWGLSFLVPLRLMRSLEPLARPLQTIADWLEPLGTDRGGMEVRLAGLDQEGKPLDKRWTLIAEAGDGPHIPAVGATILCGRLAKGSVPPGARPCLGKFNLEEVSEATRHLTVTTHIETKRQPCLFQQALGPAFDTLPEPVKDLHTVFDKRRWSGEARVSRGTSRLSNLICRFVGFPNQTARTPVAVTIERRGDTENWQRDFGGKVFKSVLSLKGKPGTGVVQERFGPFAFDIHLDANDKSLGFPVLHGRFLGLPLPRRLLPLSAASETGADGRFNFDVKISLPRIGNGFRHIGTHFVVALLSAVAAYIIALKMVHADPGHVRDDAAFTFGVVGALAGTVSGALFGEWYGRRGLSGIAVSAMASFIGPLLGGAIIGTILFPVIGTAFGVYYTWRVFTELPYFLLWAVSATAIHFCAMKLRGEDLRD